LEYKQQDAAENTSINIGYNRDRKRYVTGFVAADVDDRITEG